MSGTTQPGQRTEATLQRSAAAPRRDWAALAFALTFPTLIAWLYFMVLPLEGGPPSSAVVRVYSAGKFLQFAFPAVYVWVFERERLRPGWPSRAGLAAGLGFGLLIGAVILALYHFWLSASPLAASAPAKVYRKLEEFGAATPGRFVALALAISVGHSLLEEYYWRWFVFGWLQRLLPVAGAVLVSSLGFMAHHVVVLSVFFPGRFWALAVPLSFGVAVGGAVWARMYQRTRSLYAPWLSHMLIDMAIMAVGYQMVSGHWE